MIKRCWCSCMNCSCWNKLWAACSCLYSVPVSCGAAPSSRAAASGVCRLAVMTFSLLLQTRKHTFLPSRDVKGRQKQVTFVYAQGRLQTNQGICRENAVMSFVIKVYMSSLYFFSLSFNIYIYVISRLTSDNIVSPTFTFSFLCGRGHAHMGRGLVTQPRCGALLRPASPLWISVNFSPSPPPPRRCDSRQQQGPAPADLPGQTWRCGCSCPRSSASLPPVCRLHAGRLPAEDRRSPRRWVLMLRAWNRRCVISPSSSDGEPLRACDTSTRVPIRGDCNWNGCLLSRSDRKTFTRRFFQNTLDALYPSSRTHTRTLARSLSCTRVHSDEAARWLSAVHAQMRTHKRNSIHAHHEACSRVVLSAFPQVEKNKNSSFKIKPIEEVRLKM